MIDQYAADTCRHPESLRDLVRAGYLREIPIDPITEQRDWREVRYCVEGRFYYCDLTDVHSSSTAVSSLGTPYNSW